MLNTGMAHMGIGRASGEKEQKMQQNKLFKVHY
jgi:hypothetical protein